LPTEVERNVEGQPVQAGSGQPVAIGRSEKMSKSKKNVVDPELIISTYGADTARLFMLSDSPPDRDLDWTDSGIEGAWRYINRLFRMVAQPNITLSPLGSAIPSTLGPNADKANRLAHKTIAGVSTDLERFHFNKAVARIREFTNALGELKAEPGAAEVLRFGLESVAKLFGPMIPHICEELWQRLGHTTLLAETAWPKADPSFLQDETVTVAVQLNGKMKGTIELPLDAPKELAESAALALDSVQSQIAGKVIRKIVLVPNRIVNVVV
jgi:leucyl-tRNA synthetase